MDYILAIDPGNILSAYVVVERETLRPVRSDKVSNEEMIDVICRKIEDKWQSGDRLYVVIEMVASYGMAVGKEVFETVFWIGRFYELANGANSRNRIYRMDEKMHLCHNSRAKDSNIRQALIDRFGVVGTKKNPGWFYGFKSDIWAAYAVAVTYAETMP